MIKLALLGLLFSGMVQAQYSNESEVGIVVTGGNTEVEIYNGQTKNTYKKKRTHMFLADTILMQLLRKLKVLVTGTLTFVTTEN